LTTKSILLKYNTSFVILMLSLIWAFIPYKADCQASLGGEPPSFFFGISGDVRGNIQVPPPDLTSVIQEDVKYPSPYRFGIVLPVDVSPDHSGNWTTLPDGNQIWRATVSASGALALSAYFDRFHIPDGGKLYIYNSDKSQVIGAFSPLNNSKSGLFATELIAGDEMTMEYVRPEGSDEVPLLHLNEITYAYRGMGFLDRNGDNPGFSGKCEVNVNCPEGDDWQDQKKGVTRIHLKRAGGSYWCTGSLVNNTKSDNIPYVLTANHCGFNSTDQELQQWIFYFDYEALDCSTNVYTKPKSLTGATLKAHSGDQLTVGSDFYLVRMNENIPDSFDVFFNGWSRSEDYPSPSGVGIHHPGGDLKKISTYTNILGSSSWMGNPGLTHWEVFWSQTISGHGVTEGGSSGSPIFDNQGRIVGVLSGGESACDSSHLNRPDYYGKFSWAWSSDGNDSTSRLKDWLDPGSTNPMVLNGRYSHGVDTVISTAMTIFPNPFKDFITFSMQEFKNGEVHVTVRDIPGRLLISDNYQLNDQGSFQMNLGFLPKGLYLLRIESLETTITSKIIRQ
jgi:hypothetical protein